MKWWTGIKGMAAEALLPDADVRSQWTKAEICAICPTLKTFTEEEVWEDLPNVARMVFQAPPLSCWCGDPAVKLAGVQCGCLVLAQADVSPITVNGIPVEPAGKLTKNLHCPQGKH